MIKFIKQNTKVVFAEIPDEISLTFSISNCQNRCVGCHSAELRGNIGEELTFDVMSEIIDKNKGISCILIMGEGNDKDGLIELCKKIKEKYNTLRMGIYSGRNEVEDFYYEVFDYVKIGAYIEEKGPLNKETTNQRLYEIKNGEKIDITYKFWEKNVL